ncbi:MAG: hypothetical protein PHR55_03355 [Bacilli bacterium]|nr:hypothetical protein [Bacilli bacterium]
MEVVLFDEKGIRSFIKEYGKGPNSKDYELVVAVVLKRFCELQFGEEHCIAFKIKDKYVDRRKGDLAIEELFTILRKQIDEDDPMDVGIVRGNVKNAEKKGMSFQLKRFGKDPKKDDTEALSNFINVEIPRKYQKTETSLLIILETKKQLDFDFIKKSLIVKNYPFNKIMFIWMSSEKVYIGEIWPQCGMNEYDSNDLIRDIVI